MLYNLSYKKFLLLLLLSLLSKVYCLDVAKVFKSAKVVFENLIWHWNQQKPFGMCLLLLHVAHTLWKYTTSLLHKFMYPWHDIIAKKICGLFGGCPLFAGTTWKQQNLEGGFLKYISHYIGYVKLEFMKFSMGIDPLSSISMYRQSSTYAVFWDSDKPCKQKTVLLEEWFSSKTQKWDSQQFQIKMKINHIVFKKSFFSYFNFRLV